MLPFMQNINKTRKLKTQLSIKIGDRPLPNNKNRGLERQKQQIIGKMIA